MIDIDALFRDDPETPKVAGKPDEAARGICRQAKDRPRQLKLAKIRELARECLWRTHLERCRDCKPARPNCPNGRWMWGQYQSAIRNVVEIVKMPESPMDDRGLGHLPSCGDIESCAGPSPVAPVDGSDGEWVEIVLTPDNPPKPTDDGEKPKPICRCGSSDYVDHPIHDGQSLRRDCAICGRFIAFPVWHGPSLDELKGTSTGTYSDGETVEGVLTEKQALSLLCNDS